MGYRIKRGLLVRPFPQPVGVAGAMRQESGAPGAKPAESARILVVDDQEDVRQLLATALELEGYEVDQASTASEGLRRLGTTRYHLVLTDYAMPGGTGTWMLREASRLGFMSQTVALVVTAHPDLSDAHDTPVITKPLELDEFIDDVRTILESLAKLEVVRPQAHLRAVGHAG